MKKEHSLIIGGTKGMGRAMVRTLSSENHTVSVLARREPSGADGEIPNTHYWSVDLFDKENIHKVLNDVVEKNGKLNHLIFFQRFRGEKNNWEGEIELGLTATKSIIEALVDEFNCTENASIVVVGSVAGHLIAEEQSLGYHVAKAGLNNLARYYAVTLGHKGIRVNCVSPGMVLKEESRDYYGKNEKLHALFKEITPIGRMGTSEDIANVISFLCNKKSSFLTGQNIVVDGGLSLQWQASLSQKMFAQR